MVKGGNKNGGKSVKGKRQKKMMEMWFRGGLVHELIPVVVLKVINWFRNLYDFVLYQSYIRQNKRWPVRVGPTR